jgi:hypothetical protein
MLRMQSVRRQRYIAVSKIVPAPTQDKPSVEKSVKSDLATPKPLQQPQFGFRPQSEQMS